MPISEIRGVKFNSFQTIPELITYACGKYPDRTAVSYYADNVTIINKSYTDLHKDVMHIAEYLRSQCVAPGRICLLGECSYEWIVSFYAISWAGATPVLIDCELPDEDICALINEVGAQCVMLDKADNHKKLTGSLSENKIRLIGLRKYTGGNSVEKILGYCDRNHLPCNQWNPDDIGLIVFTSGTTGKNKAVMLTHKNMCSNLFLSFYLAGQYYLSRASNKYSTVAVLPVHHLLQFTTGVQCPIYVGCPICIGRGKRYLTQSIKQFQPSILILVPSVIEMIRKKIWAEARLNNRESKLIRAMRISDFFRKIGIDLRYFLFSDIHKVLGGNLRTIISGGAAIDTDTIREFRSWGINIFNGYGITECSPVVSCNMPKRNRDGSVGFSGLEPFCSVKIIDGEICVKGNIVMKGYYNDEVATEQAFKNGWFRTGDLGYIDDDGFLFITGRSKNLIILSNGENVSPEELELVYSRISGIKDILIYSKSKGRDTILSAIVVPNDDVVQNDNLQEYFDEAFRIQGKLLPVYKRVYEVNIRNADFIKSSNGKIKRIEENYSI